MPPAADESAQDMQENLTRILMAVQRLREEDVDTLAAVHSSSASSSSSSSAAAAASAGADAAGAVAGAPPSGAGQAHQEGDTAASSTAHARSSVSTSPETPQRPATRIRLPGASTGAKMVSVFLLKAIPCNICLDELTAAITAFAVSRGSDLKKELVPVWDKCMVYVELTNKIKVTDDDHVTVGKARVLMEPASNPSVDPVPASQVLQLRCVILVPNKDFKPEGMEPFEAYKAVGGKRSKWVKQAGVACLADKLGVDWVEAAVPLNSIRSTRPTSTARPSDLCRRLFVHLLVKTRGVLSAAELKQVDGKRVQVMGIHFVFRVEYARTSSLESKTEDDQKWKVYPRPDMQSAAEEEPVTCLSDMFEITEASTASSRVRRTKRRAGKRRANRDPENTGTGSGASSDAPPALAISPERDDSE